MLLSIRGSEDIVHGPILVVLYNLVAYKQNELMLLLCHLLET